MSRLANWKALAVVMGLVLVAAVICMINGNDGLASALIVGAILEGTVHAVLIAVASAKRRRHEAGLAAR